MTQRFATLLPLASVFVASLIIFVIGLRGTTSSIPGTRVVLVGVISSPKVALSSSGIVAANGDDGRIHFLRPDGEDLYRSETETDGHFAMSLDGKLVIAAGKDDYLHWIDPTSGEDLKEVPFVYSNILSFSLSENDRLLAIAAVNHDKESIFIFDTVAGRLLDESKPVPYKDQDKSPLVFDPSGRYLLVGGKNVLMRYDIRSWPRVQEAKAIFSDMDQPPSSASDLYVRRVPEPDRPGGPQHQLSVISFSSDGNYLMLCSDNLVTVLERRTGKFSPIIRDKLNYVAAGTQTGPNVFWLVTVGGNFKTLDPVTLKYGTEQETSPHPWGTCSADRSSDGKLYVTGVDGGHVTFTTRE